MHFGQPGCRRALGEHGKQDHQRQPAGLPQVVPDPVLIGSDPGQGESAEDGGEEHQEFEAEPHAEPGGRPRQQAHPRANRPRHHPDRATERQDEDQDDEHVMIGAAEYAVQPDRDLNQQGEHD